MHAYAMFHVIQSFASGEAMELVQRAGPDCQVPPEHVVRCFIGLGFRSTDGLVYGSGFSSIGSRYVRVCLDREYGVGGSERRGGMVEPRSMYALEFYATNTSRFSVLANAILPQCKILHYCFFLYFSLFAGV